MKYKDLIGKIVTVVRYHYGKRFEDRGILVEVGPDFLVIEKIDIFDRKTRFSIPEPTGKHDSIIFNKLEVKDGI